ncbi:hypothetical protein MXE38_09395, partial [Anaerobiospirillum sp. NML120448]|nr:hypothetical protein [Anaerobiospirillum sp. NML120448]
RGLYKAKNGALLNADVNGSINIIRKAFGDDPVKGILKCGSIYANSLIFGSLSYCIFDPLN